MLYVVSTLKERGVNMSQLHNCDSLQYFVKKNVEWFAGELVSLHGEDVLSVAVYGEAVEKEFNSKKAPINMVVIFKTVGIDTLQKSLKLVKKARKKKIVAPLFFTEEHINTSCDTFPMEFLNIQDSNLCVYGKDFFSELQIEQSNLRLVCEQKIKSILIKLRQSYLEIGLEKKGTEAIMLESFSAVLPVFRAVLRLKGEEIPQDPEQLIMQVSSLSGISSIIFMFVLRDKAGDEKVGGVQAVEYLGNYIAELTKLARYVDGM